MNKASQLATSVALAVAGFAAGTILYKHFATPKSQPAVVPSAEEPDATADIVAKATPVPDSVPDFSLPGLDGRMHSIREWRGRSLVINFWATWCAPCRREIPLLQKIRNNAANELEIVGIAVDTTEDVRKYAAAMAIDYPVLAGENEGLQVASAFGINELALPFSVFVDRSGQVLTLKLGELHEAEASLILAALRDLDDGKIDLTTAKTRVAAGLRPPP